MSRVETALDSWREWEASLGIRPVVIGALAGGRSNHSFLLDAGGQKMVLRINGSKAALPNPDRAIETIIWLSASEAGIAPHIWYTDPASTFLVSAYIENKLPSRPQDDSTVAEKALELMHSCHRLDVNAPAIDYAAHIEHYWKLIGNSGLDIDPVLREKREPMNTLLQDIIDSGTPQGLCHHDPVVENFVGSAERLYLIDWEYAARGLRVMDYAAFALEWGLDNATIATRSGLDIQLLSMAGSFYRYQCRLWETVSLSRRSGLTSQQRPANRE